MVVNSASMVMAWCLVHWSKSRGHLATGAAMAGCLPRRCVEEWGFVNLIVVENGDS